MISFEGPFFAVVILAMLALIAGSLRAERELKRRQHNFLSAVTHEFNTPIGTLRLLVQTLRLRPATPERTVDYLRRMETELDRLERTSEQVLASARLEQAGAPAGPRGGRPQRRRPGPGRPCARRASRRAAPA
jgi:two-component system, OmpR family, sensor histidine kinase SenX3